MHSVKLIVDEVRRSGKLENRAAIMAAIIFARTEVCTPTRATGIQLSAGRGVVVERQTAGAGVRQYELVDRAVSTGAVESRDQAIVGHIESVVGGRPRRNARDNGALSAIVEGSVRHKPRRTRNIRMGVDGQAHESQGTSY